MYKKIIKRETKIIIYSVCALFLVSIAVSYSLFLKVDNNSLDQVVEAGSLNITFKTGTSVDTSVCLVPTSNKEEGCLSEIEISNEKSTLPSKYVLYLYSDVESFNKIQDTNKALLGNDKIQVEVVDAQGTVLVPSKALSEYTNYDGKSGAKTVYTSTIAAGAKTTIKIRVWLDESKIADTDVDKYVLVNLGGYGEVNNSN